MAWQPCHSNPGVGLDDRKEVTFWVIGLSFLWNRYGDRGRFQHIIARGSVREGQAACWIWRFDLEVWRVWASVPPLLFSREDGWLFLPPSHLCPQMSPSLVASGPASGQEHVWRCCVHTPGQSGFIPLPNSPSTSAPAVCMDHLGLRTPPSAKRKFTLLDLILLWREMIA